MQRPHNVPWGSLLAAHAAQRPPRLFPKKGGSESFGGREPPLGPDAVSSALTRSSRAIERTRHRRGGLLGFGGAGRHCFRRRHALLHQVLVARVEHAKKAGLGPRRVRLNARQGAANPQRGAHSFRTNHRRISTTAGRRKGRNRYTESFAHASSPLGQRFRQRTVGFLGDATETVRGGSHRGHLGAQKGFEFHV